MMIEANHLQCDDEPCTAELVYPAEEMHEGFVSGSIEEQTTLYAQVKGWLVLPGHDREHHFCPRHTDCPMAKHLPTAKRNKVVLSYQHSSPSGRTLVARKGDKSITVTCDDDIRGLEDTRTRSRL
jgi:hypothetical protein